MSLRTLEKEIIETARVILLNPKLRFKDMQAWSTGQLQEYGAENVVIQIPALGIEAAFPKTCDKRPLQVKT